MKNEASLKFEKYQVELFDFKLNPDYTGKSVSAVDVNFDYANEQIDLNKFKIKITVLLNDNTFCNNTKEFYLKATLIGYFSFIGFDPKNLMHLNLIQRNTAAILFPYMRSLISHITLEAQIKPVLLPTINIINYFQEQEKKNAPQNQN